jgi:predicted lipoprotein with Yx(FWY)xxD motif
MQRPKIIIASVAVATIAAIGGTTAALAAGSSSSSAAPANSAAPASSAPASPGTAAGTVRTAPATVNGKTETILVNAQGLPLYYYQPDTAAKSLVTGQLAVLWPPLTSAMPAGAGLSGTLTAVNDAHGSQVAYNGHLLYTFVTDRPGQVTGQGVQDFFVATPGIAPLSGSSATTGNAPASGGGYGY